MVGVRIDRKRKQPVTVLLKALGWTNEQILEEFGEYESIAPDPGEGPHRSPRTRRSSTSTASCVRASRRPSRRAQTLLDNLYFNPKRYDLAKVGRYKINKKLGLDAAARRRACSPSTTSSRRSSTSCACTPARPRSTAPRGKPPIRVETDDIDHFGNRRLRTVGELIQNQVRTGLARMERVVRERMTTQDVEAITPQTLINIRPVVAAIKEFFGTVAAVAVHGPDQPARGSDPQASPVGARARAVCPVSAPASRSATSTRRTTAACARSRPRKARTSA